MHFTFLAPRSWGPLTMYKQLVAYINQASTWNYAVLKNTIIDRCITHIYWREIIISTIPLFFRPLWCKIYCYNIHWIIHKEKNVGGLWNKLLYLSYRNCLIADYIFVPNQFVVDQNIFLKKFADKINIIPNFLPQDAIDYATKISTFNQSDDIVTVTSDVFYDKCRGLIDIAQSISMYTNITKKSFTWHIVWLQGTEVWKDIFQKVKTILEKNQFIHIISHGYIPRDAVLDIYKKSWYMIYCSYQDTFWLVLLEWIAYGLRVFTNNLSPFREIIKDEYIYSSSLDLVEKMLCNKLTFSATVLQSFNIKIAVEELQTILGIHKIKFWK